MVQAVLHPVKIKIDAKDAPTGAFQDGIEQMTSDKATAAHDGHGDRGIVKLREHYSLTLNGSESAPLFWRSYGATRIMASLLALAKSLDKTIFCS